MNNILKTSGLVLINSNNYTEWRYEQIRKNIGNRILEIGCGLGNFTQYLIKDTKHVVGIDVSPEAVNFAKKRLPDIKNLHLECFDVFQKGLGKYSEWEFDTIVLSDVLEHIKNDSNAMRFCHSVLYKTRGKLLLLVPAHQFLYGTLDQESGHYKRYSKKDIIKLAKESNFIIKDIYPINLIGSIGWFINYCMLRRKNTHNSTSSFQTIIFDKYFVKPSKYLESKIKPPIGLTWVAILETDNK